jgi:hypothetical protein
MTRSRHPNKGIEPTVEANSFIRPLAGIAEIAADMADALVAVECGDVRPGSPDGAVAIDFDRVAASPGDAIGSAVKDAERAGFAVARVAMDTPT